MAGFVCKIVIENTHPPVWRRVVIPDKITFAELHDIIQILFGWEEAHPHEFVIRKDQITIAADEEESWYGPDYNEQETLVDSFFRNYKSMHYVYDFGDNWSHKINIEKQDDEYMGREAVLLKFKGDNFEEDCGGVWWAGEQDRIAFDRESVEKRLKRMEISRHEELQETPMLQEALENVFAMFRENLKKHIELMADSLNVQTDGSQTMVSAMEKKVEAWTTFREKKVGSSLRFDCSEKTQQMLLMDLGDRETADYCKYLNIQNKSTTSHPEQVRAIADALHMHPEYLCYVLDKDECKVLMEQVRLLKKEGVCKESVLADTIPKVILLGLADFETQETASTLLFASDIDEVLGALDAALQKSTYKMLNRFDRNMDRILQVYGLIEFDVLYELYHDLYDNTMEKENFSRLVYWHCRFNGLVVTLFRSDGVRYVMMQEMDANAITSKILLYSEKLSYVRYTKREIEFKGETLSNRHISIVSLGEMLSCALNGNQARSEALLLQLVIAILNGYTLEKVMQLAEAEIPERYITVELWEIICSLMLELELPMLKGRSRRQYAIEQNCSPWEIGMGTVLTEDISSKELHMYQFPMEVQEWMLNVCEYGDKADVEKLFRYKKENHVCSEEYLYLLADSCITFGYTEKVNDLIEQLKKSSKDGRSVAEVLEGRLQERYDVFDDEWDDDLEWLSQPEVSKPYVRSGPKIGRNDPCPCGSGKKYKKCCGR